MAVLLSAFTLIMYLVTSQINEIALNEVGQISLNNLSKTQERMDTVMREVVRISGDLSLEEAFMVSMLPQEDVIANKKRDC